MTQQFEKLVFDFCQAIKLPNPAMIAAGTPFETDGVAISLGYDKGNPGVMSIHTDFGPVKGLKQPIYYTLLEENFITAIGSAGSFGISALTGNVVFSEQVRLDQMTVEKLLEKFGTLADQANEWRVTHYIDDEPAPPPQPRGSGSFRNLIGK